MSAREELLARVIAWFAEHGVGDTSMRTIAAGVGTSHRMLHYHFGSREGLLGAVVEAVERGERDALQALSARGDDPYAAGLAFWDHVADAAATFAPLFFELSGQAMQRKPWAEPLRDWLSAGWIDVLTDLYRGAGHDQLVAEQQARMSLALARGLLFELALTGERAAADAAMRDAVERLRLLSTGGRNLPKDG